MSELTFEQMLEESLKTIHAGEVVEGTVIDVKPDEIVLNIGYKSDGILTKSEYSNDQSLDLTTVAKVGDTMEVMKTALFWQSVLQVQRYLETMVLCVISWIL